MFRTKKTQFFCFLIFALLFVVTLAQPTSINESSSVELAIFNFKYIWGHCDMNDWHSDFYSPHSFTIGLANNGTTKISLEEVNVSFIKLVQGCSISRSKMVISDEEGLPITLYPKYYWIQNVTCPYASIEVEIQILVNSNLVNFGKVISYSNVKDQYESWSTWSDYRFFTVTNDIPAVNFSGILTSLLIVIVWRRK
jgi:hypothetical protein